jgi:hypothetical protein
MVHNPPESLAMMKSQARRTACVLATLISAALAGCTYSSVVKSIQPVGPTISENDPFQFFGNNVPIQVDGKLNTPMTFQVSGTGTCKRMHIDFGDGSTPLEVTDVDLATRPTYSHTYTGWNGQKTVTVNGSFADDCGGSAKAPIRIGPGMFRLGYAQPVPSACMPVPGRPGLRKNTVVKLVNSNFGNTQADDAAVIHFGCVGGCYNKAEGLASAAGPGYPFPGLRERSLVVRVGAGSQGVQGGLGITTFTVTQPGPLEICINDYKIDDNTGAWGIGISIDESAAQ